MRKLIIDAKFDNYCLYAAFTALASNKNEDILLVLLHNDMKDDADACQVISLLSDFRKELMGAQPNKIKIS